MLTPRRRPIDDDAHGTVVAGQPHALQMQKSMMDEMDKRRHDWEKEMHRMQEDFFKVKLAKPQPTIQNSSNCDQLALPSSSNCTDMTATHLQPLQPEYVPAETEADDELCRWKFDVTGFEPTEIKVKVEGEKLLVSASHTDVKDGDNSSSRQLNKQTEIPHDVIDEMMTSYMTRDGVLVVQAPVFRSRDSNIATPRSAQRSHVTEPKSRDDMATVNGDDSHALECHFRPIDLPPEQSAGNDIMAALRQHVIKTDDGDEMLKVVLDLGRNDYHPDDVSVQLSTSKALIRVQHDDKLPGSNNSIRREISRDIDVPDTVYAPSMRAALSPDGRLWLGASLTTNSDHGRVTPYIVQMMPRHSQRCKRVSQLYAITN